MSNLKNSQYIIKDTSGGLGDPPSGSSNDNGSGSMGGNPNNNNNNNNTTTTTNTNGGSNNKPTADQWFASIGTLLTGTSDVIDSVSNAANGGGQQNNNNNTNQPNLNNNNNTPTNTVNPLWVGIGIGTVVLLIVGLLIYNSNGTKQSSGKSAS